MRREWKTELSTKTQHTLKKCSRDTVERDGKRKMGLRGKSEGFLEE